MDDIDFWIVQDSPIIRVFARGDTMPFLDQVRGTLGATSVGVTNGNVVTEFSDVWSRSPRPIDTRCFLTPSASSADGTDRWAIVRLSETLRPAGTTEDGGSQGCVECVLQNNTAWGSAGIHALRVRYCSRELMARNLQLLEQTRIRDRLYVGFDPGCAGVDSSDTKRVATEAIIRQKPPKTTT